MNATNSANFKTTDVDAQALDRAFDFLKAYNLGADRGVLVPLDTACVAALSDVKARESLEGRLLDALAASPAAPAKEYLCRLLGTVGSFRAVKVLAPLLLKPELSHLARFALERIPGPESTAALRRSLGRLTGADKAGVLNSLGVRRDQKSVAEMGASLTDTDVRVAAAATAALGHLGTRKAAEFLRRQLASAPPSLLAATADACLTCAERLLADGERRASATLCQELARSNVPAHFREAARKM
jgi:HEAT repeat protein